MELSFGAVGAAFIAALVSIFSLIIGKEQKTSEFRQEWINKLRDSLGEYAVNINTIVDKLSVTYNSHADKVKELSKHYSDLNKNHYDIMLRLNKREALSQKLVDIMDEFEALFASDSTATAANVNKLENKFIDASRDVLKSEWDRVREGEPTFRWAKKILLIVMAAMVVLGIILAIAGKSKVDAVDKTTKAKGEQDITITVNPVINVDSNSETSGTIPIASKPLAPITVSTKRPAQSRRVRSNTDAMAPTCPPPPSAVHY